MALKPFKPSSAAENAFVRALRKVGRVAGHIVEAHTHGDKIMEPLNMEAALKAYSKLIDPWARRQASKMLEQVSKSNRRSYTVKSKTIGKLLRETTAGQTSAEMVNLMARQVDLIKSIPIEAGIRAQELSINAVYEGRRASEIAEELARSTKVSESKAMLIARTEVARANASITQARAQAIGAQGYIWRTTMDGAERESHAKMNGKYVEYAKEPTLSDGTTGHAGSFPNCRCYQDVQFLD